MRYLQSEGFLYNYYLAVGFIHVPLIFFGDMSLQWFLRGADTLPRMQSIVNSLVQTFINFQKLGHKNKMLLHPQQLLQTIPNIAGTHTLTQVHIHVHAISSAYSYKMLF